LVSLLFAIALTSAAAQETLTVNKSEWDQLSEQDRLAIKLILQDSRLTTQNVNIVASPSVEADAPQSELNGLRDLPPASADWVKRLIKVVTKKACEAGCETSAVGAVSACGALSGGAAAAICGGLVNRARPLCKTSFTFHQPSGPLWFAGAPPARCKVVKSNRSMNFRSAVWG
jgi:hypothetical protein